MSVKNNMWLNVLKDMRLLVYNNCIRKQHSSMHGYETYKDAKNIWNVSKRWSHNCP
jgi:hypothetical protein